MYVPVIFLAFANDKDDYLDLLEEERNALGSHLEPLADQTFFQLHNKHDITIDEISKKLLSFENRIEIFHFAGHSNSGFLQLSDQAIFAEGLARQLARQDKIQLVFLNGCANKAQVNRLLELGIPAVIATSVKIEDRKAFEFADTFYYALVTNHTIEESFEIAAEKILGKTGEEIPVYRDINFEEEIEETEPLFPWGLYVKDNEKSRKALNYKLPSRSANSIVLSSSRKSYDPSLSINDRLIQLLYEAVKETSDAVWLVVETAKRKKREPSQRDLKSAIINSFPTPIGDHIRRLFIIEEVNTSRLKQILQVYKVTIDLLCFSLLSHLWEEKHKNAEMKIPEKSRQAIQEFMELDQAARDEFNYLEFIGYLGDIYFINDLKPFVLEFMQVHKEYHTKGQFFQVCKSLDHLIRKFNDGVLADDIESFCVEAEELLGLFLGKASFSIKYILTTVKSIEVEKKRFAKPIYKHNLVFLDRVEASTGVLDEPRDFDNFAENQSVILLREESVVNPFLNLSPFVIDENALRNQQNSKLFFFRYTKDGAYHYKLVDNFEDEIIVSNSHFSELKNQMNDFRRTMLLDESPQNPTLVQ